MGGPNHFLPLLMVQKKMAPWRWYLALLEIFCKGSKYPERVIDPANILPLCGCLERIFKYPELVPDPANILLLCASSERIFKYPELVVDPLLSRSWRTRSCIHPSWLASWENRCRGHGRSCKLYLSSSSTLFCLLLLLAMPIAHPHPHSEALHWWYFLEDIQDILSQQGTQ